MRCPGCTAEAGGDAKFCSHCGTALAARCGACGATAAADARFCAQCGATLQDEAAAPAAQGHERRLVSVLFADLVGYTSFSESRDPEAVRAMLSEYFDACRR